VTTGENYTAKIDIWSAGIVLYAMVVGTFPFSPKTRENLRKEIMYTDLIFPDELSDDLVDLLTKMLQKDPEKRISIEEIAAHPFFGVNDSETLEPDVVHAKALERMQSFGLGVVEPVEEMPAYRILRRCVELESRDLPPLSKSLPALWARQPIGLIFKPSPLKPRVGLVDGKPPQSPSARSVNFNGSKSPTAKLPVRIGISRGKARTIS
jgi:serine/threonine protein kinase